jgi:hypothetical protein
MTLASGSDPSARPINAIQFDIDPTGPLPDRFDEVAFRAGWNCYNGNRTPQVAVEAIKERG